MDFWRKCSTCKKEIGFQSEYYVCSVSSCNTKRTGLVFCGISCFDSHVPGARHKSAGAIEERSPKKSQVPPPADRPPQRTPQRTPQRRIVSGPAASRSSASAPATSASRTVKTSSTDVLVVASRLKDFIQNQGGFNTSQSVMAVLSDHIRWVSQMAMDNARADGRKTVMDKDFRFLNKLHL